MPKFTLQPVINEVKARTVRFGAGTGTANYFDDKELGKFVNLVAESRYNLSAVGAEIEGWVGAVDVAPSDNFSTGTLLYGSLKQATADGLQATPGTGTIAVGDYVLVGTVVAKGTALTGPARVVKATDQTVSKNTPYAARVVSLGSGNGAVGTVIVIEHLKA